MPNGKRIIREIEDEVTRILEAADELRVQTALYGPQTRSGMVTVAFGTPAPLTAWERENLLLHGDDAPTSF